MAHVSGRSEIFHLISDKQPGCPADFHPGTKSPALEPGVEGLSRDVEQAAGLRSREQLSWAGGSDFHGLSSSSVELGSSWVDLPTLKNLLQ